MKSDRFSYFLEPKLTPDRPGVERIRAALGVENHGKRFIRDSWEVPKSCARLERRRMTAFAAFRLEGGFTGRPRGPASSPSGMSSSGPRTLPKTRLSTWRAKNSSEE
ncbi:hypothetical protein [Microvirga sp. TS319]|uniref:hypothetical protein n=1 Tax=Microvirga sp. TS319 TaxID=3241165 RepID=UPI00351A6B78